MKWRIWLLTVAIGGVLPTLLGLSGWFAYFVSAFIGCIGSHFSEPRSEE